MDTIKNRIDIIHELAIKSPNLGKTAMMKYLFLLQQVYKVPLNYDFEIYTFGPYSSEVMGDIDFANSFNVISIEAVTYPSGHMGYNINAKNNPIREDSDNSYEKEIDALLELFGEKNAKELELLTTIVYLYRNAKINSWDLSREVIAQDVYEIKPHFNFNAIEEGYDSLEANGILVKAI